MIIYSSSKSSSKDLSLTSIMIQLIKKEKMKEMIKDIIKLTFNSIITIKVHYLNKIKTNKMFLLKWTRIKPHDYNPIMLILPLTPSLH